MATTFLLYGANGYVGREASRRAVAQGLRPVLAGRNRSAVEAQAKALGLEHRIFGVDDTTALEGALREARVVLNCAGPFVYTSGPIVQACLRTRAHYLDLTGEIPVLEAIASVDAKARALGVTLLPAVGFDVVPTDCLAVHLKRRLPTATRLTLAFHSDGPAGLPPGTQRTAIELLAFGERVRRKGQLVTPEGRVRSRTVDFGRGPVQVTALTWGDVFTAYYSTGIGNIETYALLPEALRRQLAWVVYLRPLFSSQIVRGFMRRAIRPGASLKVCERTFTHVWGEVEDDDGGRARSRLHGPEAGLLWTSRAAIAAVRKVLHGDAPSGFQTPGKAFGADFVLECEGVTREDTA